MTPSFVQGAANNGTSVSSLAKAFTSNVTVGNLIVVDVSAIVASGSGWSVTDSQGNTYGAALVSGSNASIPNTSQTFAAIAKTTGANTVTFTLGSSESGVRMCIHEYSSVDTFDVAATANGTTNLLTATTAATSQAVELVHAYGVSNNGVTAAGTGFTLRETASSESSEDKNVSSTGAQTATFGQAASNAWVIVVTTFYLSGGGALNGTGAGAFSFSGQATGTVSYNGTGTGAFAFSGQATGTITLPATGTGSFAFTGSATGSSFLPAAGTGAYTFTGTAAGTAFLPATGTASFAFGGAASGTTFIPGTGTGSFTFAGAATGSTFLPATGTASFTFGGSAAGTVAGQATGAATFSFTGLATGTTFLPATGAAVFTFTGHATGTIPGQGIVSVRVAGSWTLVIPSARVSGSWQPATVTKET